MWVLLPVKEVERKKTLPETEQRKSDHLKISTKCSSSQKATSQVQPPLAFLSHIRGEKQRLETLCKVRVQGLRPSKNWDLIIRYKNASLPSPLATTTGVMYHYRRLQLRASRHKLCKNLGNNLATYPLPPKEKKEKI